MRSHYRRRSFSSWAFWTTLLVGSLLYGARQFDWFPVAFLPSVASKEEPTVQPPAATAPQALPDSQIQVAEGFGQQTEPSPTEADETPARAPENGKSARARLLVQQAEGPRPKLRANPATPSTAETAEFEFPSAAPARRETGAADSQRRTSVGGIRQTAGVVERPETSDTDKGSPHASDPALAPQLQAIDELLQENDLLRAHRELSTLYWSHPQWRPELRSRIENSARVIYFDRSTNFLDPYIVQANDQLAQIAKPYDVPWEYLARLNGIDAKKIRPGQRLKVLKGPFSAIIELNSFLLTVHAYGYYVRAYPIGIGKQQGTPTGKFSVLNKVRDPQYTDPQGRVLESDDPNNPLGKRWLDLGNGYGIHGTVDPGSIGRAESRGCIRMRNEDVAEVYDLLAVGSQVTIRP